MPGKKSKHREGAGKEKSESTVSRRTVLKTGAAAGAVTVLAPHIISPGKALASLVLQGGSVAPPLAQCNANATDLSSSHTPFKDELPIPFPAIDHPLSPPPPRGRQHPG